jgi:hypothetical protein
MKRVLLALLASVVLVVVGGVAFVMLKQPAQRPASTEKIASTPEMVARGKYLAESASCLHCHTEVQPTRWSMMGNEEKKGAGGLC